MQVSPSQELQEALQPSSKGDIFASPLLVDIAHALCSLSVPQDWAKIVGSSSPPTSLWGLQEWLTDLGMRQAFLDKVLGWGLERTPTFWLGAFYNPHTLLSIIHQV